MSDRAPDAPLVVGIGNLLLRDDGVGVHAVRQFREFAGGIMTVDAGTAVLAVEYLVADSNRLLVFDAMYGSGKPGSLYAMPLADAVTGEPLHSLHDLSLSAVLRLCGNRSPDALVIGVEPELIDFGLELSPAVQAALPAMLQAAVRVLEFWRTNPTSRADCQIDRIFCAG